MKQGPYGAGALASARGRTLKDYAILLVDDDALMHRMLVPRLKGLEGARSVLSALTPQSAIEQAVAAPPGPLIVLSDFNLKAAMNGLDLLATLREKRPDSLRVLLSGYSAEQLGDVRAQGAVHAFIEKPMRIDDMLPPLVDLIRRHLAE